MKMHFNRSKTSRRKNTSRQFQTNATIQDLEPRQLLSATASPTETTDLTVTENVTTTIPVARLNTPEKVARHLEIHEQVNQGDADVLLIGDSITQRWDWEGAEVFTNSFSPSRTINMGIGGDQTQNLLWRLQDYNLSNLSPKLAVLNIGTNNVCHPSAGECTGHDSSADVAAGVLANVEWLREALPDTKILLIGILPRDASADGPHRETIAVANRTLADAADFQDVHFFDLADALTESDGSISSETMFDYLHLTSAGYQTVANEIQPIVDSLTSDVQQIHIEGTDGDDSFRFVVNENGYRVHFNGKVYEYDSLAVEIQFEGKGGKDVVRLEGGDAGSRATLGLTDIRLVSAGYSVIATDIEYKTVVVGDGFNFATIDDSPGDDRFVAHPELSYITGDGLYSAAIGFDRIDATATLGYDFADLYDSVHDDVLLNNPTDVSLSNPNQSASDYFRNSAKNFDYVRSNSINGGSDEALFFDSVNDDFFVGRPNSTYMRDAKNSWFNHSNGFAVNHAYSQSGGTDEAQFFDSAGNDEFLATSNYAMMKSLEDNNAYENHATGFARAMGYSRNGGNDVAKLFAATDTGKMQARQSDASILGDEFMINANGFIEVQAHGTSGNFNRLEQESGLRYLFVPTGTWHEIISV